jgi:hypothetical protein
MIKKLILKYKLQKIGFKWIKVPKSIIKKYRDTTAKNKTLDDFTIKYKINREFYSGKISSINDKRSITNYGYMEIIKDNEKNEITYILNSKSNRCGKIDYEIKDKITKIYESVYGGEI